MLQTGNVLCKHTPSFGASADGGLGSGSGSGSFMGDRITLPTFFRWCIFCMAFPTCLDKGAIFFAI